jgi:hypothetical protein
MLSERRFLYLSAVVALSAAVPHNIAVERPDRSPIAAPVIAPVEWVKFEDPNEHAFTMDVPKGWTARGGLIRLGYSDHRPMVDVMSPDGKINVRYGDAAIPIYFVPDNLHRAGDIYDLGAQARGTLAPYKGGADFASAYGPARFKSVCATLAPRPASGPSPVPRFVLEPGELQPTQSSAGQMSFDCAGDAGPRVAYVSSETMLFGGFWLVPRLVSYVAPADQAALARSVMLHMTESYHEHPEWVAQQKQYDAAAVEYQRRRQQGRMQVIRQQVAQFETNMQAMQNQVNTFERGQAARQKQVDGFLNVLNGVTPTVDPYGNPHNVNTGPKANYWINGLGQTVNSTDSPGPDYVQLTPKQQ